jgi:hypothetical protein
MKRSVKRRSSEIFTGRNNVRSERCREHSIMLAIDGYARGRGDRAVGGSGCGFRCVGVAILDMIGHLRWVGPPTESRVRGRLSGW